MRFVCAHRAAALDQPPRSAKINSIDVNLKTTDYGGVAQPAGEPSVSPTENFFLRILEEAGLAHINVTANPPYVALFDGLNRRAAMRC